MIEFRFVCTDGIGIGAAITGSLRRAEINIRYCDFKAIRTSPIPFFTMRRVRCIVVVQDSNAHQTETELKRLQRRRSDLRIKGIHSIYRLRIRLPDEPGILDNQVRKLAREGIYLRRCRGPELPVVGSDLSAIFFLELEGSLEKYVRAKSLLHEYIVEEAPDFPGGIISLQF